MCRRFATTTLAALVVGLGLVPNALAQWSYDRGYRGSPAGYGVYRGGHDGHYGAHYSNNNLGSFATGVAVGAGLNRFAAYPAYYYPTPYYNPTPYYYGTSRFYYGGATYPIPSYYSPSYIGVTTVGY